MTFALTIKGHILAGHYPKDEQNRALVPTFEGATATICEVDAPFNYLIGWIPTTAVAGITVIRWREDGRAADRDLVGCDLLIPPPRKARVNVEIIKESDGRWAVVKVVGDNKIPLKIGERLEFTTEIEEPWA